MPRESNSVVGNSVTWYYDSETNITYVLADTDGDTAKSEIEIALAGKVTLTQNDFIP